MDGFSVAELVQSPAALAVGLYVAIRADLKIMHWRIRLLEQVKHSHRVTHHLPVAPDAPGDM